MSSSMVGSQSDVVVEDESGLTPSEAVLDLLNYELDFLHSIINVYEMAEQSLNRIRRRLDGNLTGWTEEGNAQIVMASIEATLAIAAEHKSDLGEHISGCNRAIIGLEVGNPSMAIADLEEAAAECRVLAYENPDQAHLCRSIAVGNDVLIDELKASGERSAVAPN